MIPIEAKARRQQRATPAHKPTNRNPVARREAKKTIFRQTTIEKTESRDGGGDRLGDGDDE